MIAKDSTAVPASAWSSWLWSDSLGRTTELMDLPGCFLSLSCHICHCIGRDFIQIGCDSFQMLTVTLQPGRDCRKKVELSCSRTEQNQMCAPVTLSIRRSSILLKHMLFILYACGFFGAFNTSGQRFSSMWSLPVLRMKPVQSMILSKVIDLRKLKQECHVIKQTGQESAMCAWNHLQFRAQEKKQRWANVFCQGLLLVIFQASNLNHCQELPWLQCYLQISPHHWQAVAAWCGLHSVFACQVRKAHASLPVVSMAQFPGYA